MKSTDKELAEKMIHEVTNSNMTLQKKMILFKLLDEAFRKHLGVFYLSNKELEENDILFRSM